jgi:hypothetical protein
MNEAEAWAAFQKNNAGKWVTDPIHNGLETDLLFYKPQPSDPSRGIYVNVSQDGGWSCGEFTGAVPHITEALYTPSRWGKASDFNAALSYLGERLGLGFLHALTKTAVSPFKHWT